MAKLSSERIVAGVVALLPLLLLARSTRATPVKARTSVDTFVTGWHNRTICLEESCLKTAIALLSSVDRNVDPCDNFYKFACGNWNVQNRRPPSTLQWTHFGIMAQQVRDKIKDILTSPIASHDIESVNKAKMSYQTCMDEDKIDEMGLEGIEKIIRLNGGWPMIMPANPWTAGLRWQRIHQSYAKRAGVAALFSIGVLPDVTETGRNMIWVKKPMTFRLPRAQLAELDENPQLKHVYMKYIWSVVYSMKDYHKSMGRTKPILTSIQNLIEFEIRLSHITWPLSAEDSATLNNVVTIDELQSLYDSANPRKSTAQINWLETIRNAFSDTPEIVINGREKIRIPNEGYIRGLVNLLNVTSEETIANYIHWKMIDKTLLHTTRAMRDNIFQFLNEISGLDYSQSRESVCMTQTGLDHAIGYAYVKDDFDENSKTTAERLMKQIQEAMARQIETSPWLDQRTKKLAKEKLSYVTDLIGYPDWYTKTGLNNYYNNLKVGPVYIDNVLSRWQFAMRENHRELRMRADRKKWPVTPTTTNAYYNIRTNAVIIPAAILQPPFFNPQRPEAVNYGSIGAIIGHEISHGFDDKGRQYDKDGNIHQWWADTVIEQYKNRTECFVEQFNKYKIYENGNETIWADGRNSLGENIADTIGFQLAHSAFEQRQQSHYQDFTLPRHEEYTNEQLFFLSLANMWCADETDEHLKHFAPRDKHSIPSLRVIGALSNMESFSKAFNCPAGSPMNPTRKCSIWS